MLRATKRWARPRTRRGVLTFEWILLISLLVIGVIGGLSAVRNSLLGELKDMAQAVQSLSLMGGANSNSHQHHGDNDPGQFNPPFIFDPSNPYGPGN